MKNGLIRSSLAALARATLCVAACGGMATSAAAPTLPTVVAGQATFDQQGHVFSITNTPGTIINWQGFSVNAGELTRFIQQSSDSAVLNRVTGQDPSRILGALQSNGKVFLINPNGVVFGLEARVDVAGLVASTLGLGDADFLAGKKHFTAGPNAGALRNEGSISTPGGGQVLLLAPNVENSGVITAPGGEVVLAAGRSVQLADARHPDLSVVVSAPSDAVVNLGQVVAQAGRIGIYGALVNQLGVVNANSAVLGKDGRIFLKARLDTVLAPGSVTSATGAGKGGEITLLGTRVGLAGNAAVSAGAIDIVAGASGLELNGSLEAGSRVTLRSAGALYQGGEAAVRAPQLLVEAATVSMMGANEVGTLAGAATATGDEATGFRFNWLGDLHVGAVGDRTGVASPNDVTLLGDALVVDSGIGGRVVSAHAASITGAGTLEAEVLALSTRGGGIGTVAVPLRTSAGIINATNTGSDTATDAVTGSAPINIVNDRAVVLGNVVQAGSGNGGAISIESTGGLTVSATDASADGVKTSSGNIRLVTRSPMTIHGKVSTGSGNITLLADNGGLLTITPGALVASSSGNVSITAGATEIAEGSIVVSSRDKLSVTTTRPPEPPKPEPEPEPEPPSLDTCLADPNVALCGPVLEQGTLLCLATPDAPGCGAVLGVATRTCRADPNAAQCTRVLAREAIRQCIADPDAPGCGATLPAYALCLTSPATYGCAPVIQREPVKQCIANPDGPGCGSTLPSYAVCLASPATYGCAPVIQREPVRQCIVNPDAPGCAATLPSYEVCAASPAVYGCAPVVQREPVRQCIANPKAPGCTATLPAYEVCAAAPATYGCVPVLAQREAVKACIAAPTAPGCGDVLPLLTECRANGSVFGCAPVLARAEFVACLANPTAAGCAARLPALQVCQAAPGIEGCAQVRQVAFNACLLAPNDASCIGILPTLSQCVASKASAGCEVVLPTLAQCIGSPTLQGCSVQLPKLEQCAANPNMPGCEAVLPTPDFCRSHPKDPACSAFDTAPAQGGVRTDSALATAQQASVDLIQRVGAGAAPEQSANRAESQSENQTENQAGPVPGTHPGVKNEKPATKMYCN